MGHQARRGRGLRKLGFSEVETSPTWTSQAWLAVPWRRPQPRSQEAGNAGGHRQCGSGQAGLPECQMWGEGRSATSSWLVAGAVMLTGRQGPR